MTSEGDSTLRKKVEAEFPEETLNIGKLITTLIKSFLKSDSNYGVITDIKTDMHRIYSMVRAYIDEEKMDVYALMLDDRILLSRTSKDFEDIYEVIKARSKLQIKKDMIEIWDDEQSRILHLIIVPVRKHFPLDYSTPKEKTKLIEHISSMTWQVA